MKTALTQANEPEGEDDPWWDDPHEETGNIRHGCVGDEEWIPQYKRPESARMAHLMPPTSSSRAGVRGEDETLRRRLEGGRIKGWREHVAGLALAGEGRGRPTSPPASSSSALGSPLEALTRFDARRGQFAIDPVAARQLPTSPEADAPLFRLCCVKNY